MSRCNLILFIFSIFCAASCGLDRQSRSIRRETKKQNGGGIRFIAASRDTINYILVFYGNNHFWISEGKMFGRGHYYAGQYEDRNDTIFLTYYKNIEPSQMADFLIKDTGRILLLYPYKEGGKPLYLVPEKPNKSGSIRSF
jgi:hypothetical protein